MMLWKCCTQYASKFGKLSNGHRTGKGLFSFQPHCLPLEVNAKECSNYHTITFISHASKEMLKILEARLQQYVNWELSDVPGGFRKGQRSNCQYALDHRKSKRIPEKHHFCFIDYAKALDCVDHSKLWKTLTEMGPLDLPLEKSVCRSGSNN